MTADVGLDSRMHVSLCGPASLAAELQRRYTPLVLAEAHECIVGSRHRQ